MSAVGTFPGFQNNLRRTVRAPINPNDKSTVVSIFPKAFKPVFETIIPGRFHVEAGSYEKPALLTVGPSSYWLEVNDSQPLQEIPCGSHQVANSIVNDFANGLIGCNMTNAMPGIFWLPGEITIIALRTTHKAALELAKIKQDAFWKSLVKLADIGWARTNGSPLTISDEMRMAAKELNLTEKEWMKDFATMQKTNCKACGSMVNPGYPVCQNCKAIVDPEKAKALGITFAA